MHGFDFQAYLCVNYGHKGVNHEQIPISDRDIILEQHKSRTQNHIPSALSMNKSGKCTSTHSLNVGDLIYLYSDKDKSRARSRS